MVWPALAGGAAGALTTGITGLAGAESLSAAGAGALFGTGIGAGLGLLFRRRPVFHGSARFRTRRELQPLRNGRGLIVGRERPGGRLLRHDGPGHLLTLAPTRSGKGVGAVLPNLLTADRPVIVIDPKGENYRIAAPARRAFGPVHALDPFRLTGAPGSRFNPLAGIDPAGDRTPEDAADLAEAMVVDARAPGEDGHWNGEARALLAGLLLHCLTATPPEDRNLTTLRRWLSLPPEGVRALLAEMQANPALDGMVARAAERRQGKSEREASAVVSTAQRHTHFLDSPRIADSLAASSFRLRDLMRRNGSLFLVLPPDRLAAHAGWLRLLIARALAELMQDPSPRTPVLLMLDECAALGRMKPVEQGFGLAAGYGVQIWAIFQDVHQLRAAYGAAADSFLANAGVTQAFHVNDHDTAQWLSAMLGARTVPVRGQGETARGWTARALLTPDEVLAMHPERMLVLPRNGRPILAWKPRYHTDPEFAHHVPVADGRESGPPEPARARFRRRARAAPAFPGDRGEADPGKAGPGRGAR